MSYPFDELVEVIVVFEIVGVTGFELYSKMHLLLETSQPKRNDSWRLGKYNSPKLIS